MSPVVRVLIVEDSDDDAELMRLALVGGGIVPEVRRVETPEEMQAALNEGTWECVLSDFRLPRFSATAALDLLRQSGQDVPFLIVSGTIGEDQAVELMRAGAHDYILKNRLGRLVPAVERELHDAAARRTRREAEAQARRAEQLLERQALILANVRDSVIVTDPEGIVTYWNQGATRLFGWSAEEMLGRSTIDRYPVDMRARVQSLLAQIRDGTDWDGEFEDYRQDGTRVWIDARVRRITDEAGQPIALLGVSHDVSERKRLEHRLRQSQKMEAIGQLAGGIAHDFNNLLTIIVTCVDLAIDSVGEGTPTRGLLDEVRRAADRSAALTRQLLAFSRRQGLAPRVVDLNEIVHDAERMLQRVIGEEIRLETRLAARLDAVLADPGQLTQVVLNLAVNARDAMPGGGTLSIATEPVELDRSAARDLAGLPPGRYVRLTVSDSGEGMSPEVQQRLFEPFFTTKGPGKGTGLGLAVVHGIVTQSDGHIEVVSAPGRGSSFRVYLPAHRAPPAASRPEAPAPRRTGA